MARLIKWEDLGDARVRVIGESDQHRRLSIVVYRNLIGTPDLQTILDMEGQRIDGTAEALDARHGLTDSEE